MNKVPVNQATDLSLSNDMGNMILQERKMIQNHQGLYQSWEGLVRMKDQIPTLNANQKET